MKALFAILALISCNAFSQWGGAASAYQGYQEGQNRELLRQCMQSCSQGDGQCYRGCSGAYGQRPQQQAPQYQAPQWQQQPQQQQLQPQQLDTSQKAWFTGNQEFTSSVTGLSIVRCQYDYSGTSFWRNYRANTTCPQSVAVE